MVSDELALGALFDFLPRLSGINGYVDIGVSISLWIVSRICNQSKVAGSMVREGWRRQRGVSGNRDLQAAYHKGGAVEGGGWRARQEASIEARPGCHGLRSHRTWTGVDSRLTQCDGILLRNVIGTATDRDFGV